jgi:NAD(P)-dependent dehydrogenase (short-subunit alcohol dehydrogenase family)
LARRRDEDCAARIMADEVNRGFATGTRPKPSISVSLICAERAVDPSGKRIYVTGGASGIGLRVAEIFAARGAQVAVFDLDPRPEALRCIEAARRGAAQQVRGYAVDVADAGATATALRQAAADLGTPDVLFHAAGVGGFSRRFDEFPADRFERLVRVNLLGSRNVAAAGLPLMSAGSRLVFVASLAGLVGAFGQSGYAASKHGVVGLASVLRLECRPKGIAVCVICPPEIDTPMAREDRRTRPPETTAMKLFAGTVELDAACRYMVERVLRGQFLIIPGRRAQLTWLMQKLLPRALTDAIADRMVARVQAREGG